MRTQDLILKFEGMSSTFIDEELSGLIMELEKEEQSGFIDPRYVQEKIRNASNHLKGVLDNFAARVKHPEIRAEFLKFIREQRALYCPLCHGLLGKRPATSRKDSKTMICSACGVNEAMSDFEAIQDKQKESLLPKKEPAEKEYCNNCKRDTLSMGNNSWPIYCASCRQPRD